MPTGFYYGGQAVIEGVMMRGEKGLAVGVRHPNGEVVVSSNPLASIYTGWLRRTPFLRGVVVLIESMVLGMKTLVYSANVALQEEDTEEGEQGFELPTLAVIGMLTLSLAFAVALFFILPLLLTRLTDPHIASSLVSNLVEGGIRLVIFVAYLKVIGMMPSIRRVFSYHGAEHKTINAYEAGVPLEPKHVQHYSTAHTRCGTSFLLAVLVIAILVFSLLGRPPLWIRMLSRVALLPVIAALGYETLRLSARFHKNRVMAALTSPGLALQALTTRQPADDQVEVAVAALKRVLEMDGRMAAPAASDYPTVTSAAPSS